MIKPSKLSLSWLSLFSKALYVHTIINTFGYSFALTAEIGVDSTRMQFILLVLYLKFLWIITYLSYRRRHARLKSAIYFSCLLDGVVELYWLLSIIKQRCKVITVILNTCFVPA